MNEGDPVTRQQLNNIDSSISRLSGNLSSMTQALVQSNNATKKYMEKVLEEVKETGKETVRHMKQLGEISCLIEINKQASQLEIIDPLIRKQANSLQTEYDRVQTKMSELLNQFKILFDELIETYQIDIRKLGSHIFEILENDYQRNIENRYYIGTYQKMESASRSIAQNRSGILSRKFENFVSSIKNFFGLRDEFNQSISNCIIPLETSTDTGVEIPFWVVETSDESGATQYQIFFDQAISSHQNEDGSQCSIMFEPLSRFTDMNKIIDNMGMTTLMNNRLWQSIDPATMDSLDNGIATLVQEGFVQQDLKEHMNESIRSIQIAGEVADVKGQRRTYSPQRKQPSYSFQEYSAPGNVAVDPYTKPTLPETPFPETTFPEEPYVEPTLPEEPYAEPTLPDDPFQEPTLPEEPFPETTPPEEPYAEPTLPEEPYAEPTLPEEPFQEPTLPEEPYTEFTNTLMKDPEPSISETQYTEPYTDESYPDHSFQDEAVHPESEVQEIPEQDTESKQVQCAHCHNDLAIEVYGDFICPYCHRMTYCNSNGSVFRTEREMKEEAYRW